MSFRKPRHMPFRKLVPPFTLTAFIFECERLWFEIDLFYLLWNSENREHMKNFRIVDCVVNNHNNVQDTPAKPQNHKLTTVAVCCLVFSCPSGYFLATQ